MKAMNFARFRGLAGTALLLAVLSLTAAPARADWVSADAAIMGTAIHIELWQDSPQQGREAIAAVFDEMHRIDARMSTWKEDSILSDVNRRAATETVELDDEFVELIGRALAMSRMTGGAFDITYASVGRLYDYRAGSKPDDGHREAALDAVDYRYVELDSVARTVHYARQGVHIDLGGIAKGYAVENAAEILRNLGVRHAIVTAGGDSRIVGDRRGRPWTVGIRDPRNPNGLATRVPLQDEAVSTSGDYERFFEADGERFHHIIHPDTGRSADQVRSVTIIGADATETDALSTGVFVLGPQRGLELIEALEDFEAIIVDADGRMHYSSGLMPAQAAR